MNKVEAMKAVKDGLEDIPGYAADGWESIPEAERDRLK